jgi:hypothetical protein
MQVTGTVLAAAPRLAIRDWVLPAEFGAKRSRRPLVRETPPDAEAGPVVRAVASVAIHSHGAADQRDRVVAKAIACRSTVGCRKES